VNPAQFAVLKARLTQIYDPQHDSLRFYFLGKRGHQKIEHIGAKLVADPLRDALIL
jgi:CRISPR-associated protein Cas2